MRLGQRTNQNETRGNAIVLLLPFTVVIVALVQLALVRSTSFNTILVNFRSTGVRDALVSNINMYSSIPATFRNTLQVANVPLNPDLQNCVFGTGPSPCQAGVEMPVTLFSPISSTTIISGPAALNGAPTQPALYDNRGNLCANATGSASEQCPFEVTTSFTATCASGTLCSVAQSLTVHYTVRRWNNPSAGATAFMRGSIVKDASAILISKILPDSSDAASGNKLVTAGTSVLSGTDGSSNANLLTQILSAIKVGAPSISDGQASDMAQKFLESGYKDMAYVTRVAAVEYDKPHVLPMIEALGILPRYDDATLKFLAEVDVGSPVWLQIVLDSGTTDTYWAHELYDWGVDSGTLLSSIISAVGTLPHDPLTGAIAREQVTDPVLANKIYSQLSFIPDKELAGGMAAGGWYDDPVKMNAILAAVNGIPPAPAAAMAEYGITDPVLAKQLYDITSVLNDAWLEKVTIWWGDLNPAETQKWVTHFMDPAYGASQTTTTASTTTTTTTTGTTNSTIVVDTLISTCTTCSGVTF